eukprot:4589246-Amphidinium_carterae.1
MKARGQSVHHRRGTLKEQSLIQLDYAYRRSSIPTNKNWQVNAILTCVETTTGLCMAIPRSKKGPTRYQLTQLKTFIMESGFGQSIVQVDYEPAFKQLAEEAERELIQYCGGNHRPIHIRDKDPWRDSTKHYSHK